MDCPNCGQWNPDDKQVCWRCQTALPTPPVKKAKRPTQLLLGLPVWAWLAVIAFVAISAIGQCSFLPAG